MKELIIRIVLLGYPAAFAKEAKTINDCSHKSIKIKKNCKNRVIPGKSSKSSCDNKCCLLIEKKVDYVK